MESIYHKSFSRIFTWTLVVITAIAQVSGHTILEEYTCGQSDIEYGVTLKDGTLSGVFRDQGNVKNMQACIHKCCMSKQCDVAMMTGKKCFGVRCHNGTSCETVPSDDRDLDMQIAHVTSKGMNNLVQAQSNDSTRFDPDAKCPHNEVLYNVKLKAGLHAGKFSDIGKVKSIMTCVRYCCESKIECDLAFMLKDRCYLLKCFSEDRCQALPARGEDFSFNQKMAFVAPWLFEKNKKIVNVPSGQSPHHLQCIQSKLYKDSQLLAGPRAGHYADVGPVGNVHTCTRLCCEDSSCDVAYMFGKNCFMVSCYDEKGCRVVSSKPREGKIGDKASKNSQIHKTVQYIVKRKFGVAVREDGKHVKITKPGENTCRLDGKIHKKAVLKAGMLSGKLTLQKKAHDMKTCIKRCCKQKTCHVAMMMSDMCYSVYCTNPDYCTIKDAPVEALHKNPTLAFVRRGEISFAPESRSTIKNPLKPSAQNPFESLKLLAGFPKLQLSLETPVETVSYASPVMNGEDETGVQEQQ